MDPYTSAEHYPISSGSSQNGSSVRLEEPHSSQRTALAQAIEALPQRLRLVLNLIYFEALSFYEAATVLELAESQVHALHDQAIQSLNCFSLEG